MCWAGNAGTWRRARLPTQESHGRPLAGAMETVPVEGSTLLVGVRTARTRGLRVAVFEARRIMAQAPGRVEAPG